MQLVLLVLGIASTGLGPFSQVYFVNQLPANYLVAGGVRPAVNMFRSHQLDGSGGDI